MTINSDLKGKSEMELLLKYTSAMKYKYYIKCLRTITTKHYELMAIISKLRLETMIVGHMRNLRR